MILYIEFIIYGWCFRNFRKKIERTHTYTAGKHQKWFAFNHVSF